MIASEPLEHDVIAALFVPANRPEGFERAAAFGADAAILDPEDAVSSNARRRRVPRSEPTSPIVPSLYPWADSALADHFLTKEVNHGGRHRFQTLVAAEFHWPQPLLGESAVDGAFEHPSSHGEVRNTVPLRVGLILSGDVRSRPVRRLKKAVLRAKLCAWGHTHASDQSAAEIRKDVAEHVLHHQNVELPGLSHQIGSSLQARVLEAAREVGLDINMRVHVFGFDGIRRMVEAGLGIAILPQGAVLPYLDSRSLTAMTLDEPWANRTLYVGYRDYRALPLVARHLVVTLAPLT